MVAARSWPTQTFELVEGEADGGRGENNEDNEDQEEIERGAGRRLETREGAEAPAEVEAEAEARRERGEVGAEEGAHTMRGEEEGVQGTGDQERE
jgi:hypothetical protein